MVAIGIDLGTTCSCVAVWRNGGVEVIPNERGDRTTASYVAFTSTEVIVGDAAKGQAVSNLRNTVFGIKRLIGRSYDDLRVQSQLRRWPFAVIDDDGKPSVVVEMKELAEDRLGTEVKDAVVTVPAYFNDSQRRATRTAGAIAGLNVARILDEPTAAALAYGVDDESKGIKNVLIYDLGGGTFDVSIVTVEDGTTFRVRATAGNTNLGGEDFDGRIVAYFNEDFAKTHARVLFDDHKALARLRIVAESAKKCLTSSPVTRVHIESLTDGIDYSCELTREMFEELCSDLFIDTLKPVKQALSGAKMIKSDIHDVILVGGSSKIPKIQSLVKGFFDGKPLIASINPDEVVAYGAAVQAAILSGVKHEKIPNTLLVDVVPLSLGIETARGLMFRVIEKNTPTPCRRIKEVSTLEDNQTVMTIEVFEGERSLTKDNKLLGVFELTGIPPAPRGVPKIDLVFDVDANGILSVMAHDKSTGSNNGIVIKNECRLNPKDIEKMIANAIVLREEDEQQKMRLQTRNNLETYIFSVRRAVKEDIDKLKNEEKNNVLKKCEDILIWLDQNTDRLAKDDFEMKMAECSTKWSEILNRLCKTDWNRCYKRQKTENRSELAVNDLATNEENGKETNGNLY
ncbi:Heat shock protein 70 B2 [Eumeta japonica]|uniref:Heat shock protein 70 B2 n=1 Tax=Eumeta variegata TaxID=151549 RepID=A0A4C1Z2U3_EUMVA|nr:Heat shock protein 70 B2 [Eumeta japonica]